MMKRFISIVFLSYLSIVTAFADEYRPAYLELTQTSENNFDVLWKVPAKGDQRLALYVSFSSDVTESTDKRASFISGSFIERSSISRKKGLAGEKITIQGLERVSTDVLVRIQYIDKTTETSRLNAASTSFVVKGTPQFWQVVNTYLFFGIEHILTGLDHLLFVACLIFIAGSWRRIVVTITGFTLAHSFTLTLAALELVHIPIQPIEVVIALSIVFLAREIILSRKNTLTWRYPIAVSATFGLLHGFGFASALSDIGLPSTEISAALFAFNVGVEIGQISFVALIVLLSGLIKRLLKTQKISSDNGLVIIEKSIGYAVGSITLFWTFERISGFWI